MNAKIFMNYSNFNLYSACGFTIKSKSFCTTHYHIFVCQFRLNPQKLLRKSLKISLWFRAPALYFDYLLSCLERNNCYSISTQGISAFIISRPYFYRKFRPSSYCFCFVVKIKRMVPLSDIFSFIFYFFICFPSCFSIN